LIYSIVHNARKLKVIQSKEHIDPTDWRYLLLLKGRYKTGGTGQLYDGFPDCEWKMNTP
jgi:hypothetical protein